MSKECPSDSPWIALRDASEIAERTRKDTQEIPQILLQDFLESFREILIDPVSLRARYLRNSLEVLHRSLRYPLEQIQGSRRDALNTSLEICKSMDIFQLWTLKEPRDPKQISQRS